MSTFGPVLAPDRSPQSVRTLPVLSSCPICGTALAGRQTVCSAKCRIARSRQRRENQQAERDAKVRLLLNEALLAVYGEMLMLFLRILRDSAEPEAISVFNQSAQRWKEKVASITRQRNAAPPPLV